MRPPPSPFLTHFLLPGGVETVSHSFVLLSRGLSLSIALSVTTYYPHVGETILLLYSPPDSRSPAWEMEEQTVACAYSIIFISRLIFLALKIIFFTIEIIIRFFLREYNSVVCISVVIPRYIVNITSPSQKYLAVCVSLDSIGEMSRECLVINCITFVYNFFIFLDLSNILTLLSPMTS